MSAAPRSSRWSWSTVRVWNRHITHGGARPSQVLDWGVAVADALGAAHAQGIVHRDVKPGNVVLTTDGRVKVLDFGLAKQTHAAGSGSGDDATLARMSMPGQVMGTVPYMAPEQVRGEAVDPRTDVFALGVVLYELSTGSRPFEGATLGVISSAILRDTPAPLAKVRPGSAGRPGARHPTMPREGAARALPVGE